MKHLKQSMRALAVNEWKWYPDPRLFAVIKFFKLKTFLGNIPLVV